MFSYIQERETVTPAADYEALLINEEEMAGLLHGLWHDIHHGNQVDTNSLFEIVNNIAKMVQHCKTSMLPLAVIKKHDEYTFLHVVNVAILSAALGESLGFDNPGIHELCMAALLHDIGKRYVPTELLSKKDSLTEEEWERLQSHPEDGASLLLSTPGVPELAIIAAYEHHMNADGSGYPKAAAGWKQNLASRIIQVADVYDALRTNRPYRRGLPLPQIIQIMQSGAGSTFDTDLLELFFEYVMPRQNADLTPLTQV
jgi:HD-GYP domain-containing protein (c-di-GMP phosphodiesterase class II)